MLSYFEWDDKHKTNASYICRETKNVLLIWFIFLQRENISYICDKKLDSLLMEWLSVSTTNQ